MSVIGKRKHELRSNVTKLEEVGNFTFMAHFSESVFVRFVIRFGCMPSDLNFPIFSLIHDSYSIR
jgi:hypothetical protein